MVKILRDLGDELGLRTIFSDKLDMMEKTFTADTFLVRKEEDDREEPARS